MSIERCHLSHLYDTDFVEQCPICLSRELAQVISSMNHMGGDEQGGYCICPMNDGSALDHRHATTCMDARIVLRKAEGRG